MRIEAVEISAIRLRLREPYKIAYQEITHADNVLLRLACSDGTLGWGSAAPEPEITGETLESTLTVLRDIIEPNVKGMDPLRMLHILEPLGESLKRAPSAKAALDMALHDLTGKIYNTPVWKLLGGYRNCIPTSITIGILPLEETVKRAKRFVGEGFGSLKIKGGCDLDQDCEKLRCVRAAVGNSVKLRFDANQGYTVAQAKELIGRTESVDLELIEQPTSEKDFEGLGAVTNSVPIPVMADESMHDLIDVFKLARNELVDMVNVKLMKVGGIAEALRVTAVAQAAGLEVMVGCMDEIALGISAGLHFALARPNVQYADLDGHFDLLDDPTAGCVVLKNGVLYPNGLPGLGYAPGL